MEVSMFISLFFFFIEFIMIVFGINPFTMPYIECKVNTTVQNIIVNLIMLSILLQSINCVYYR